MYDSVAMELFFSSTCVVLSRKKLLKKRMSKGPYKIILTTSDFVFPQVPRVDSRRVSTGDMCDKKCASILERKFSREKQS